MNRPAISTDTPFSTRATASGVAVASFSSESMPATASRRARAVPIPLMSVIGRVTLAGETEVARINAGDKDARRFVNVRNGA